jgi:hypothetical protein
VTTRGGTYPATPVIFAAMRRPIQFPQAEQKLQK